MKYKALVSFSGLVNMRAGDVADVDPAFVDDLLRAGYIIPFEADAKADAKPEKKASKPKTTKGKGKKNED